MDHNFGVRTLLNAADNKLLGLLAVLVRDYELWTVVEEGVSSDSERLSENEAHPVSTADFIDGLYPRSGPEHLSDDNHVVVGDDLIGELSEHSGLDVRVEGTKLTERSFSPGGVANVGLTDVEVGSHVAHRDLSGVIDGHRLGTSKAQVLRCFDTETSHTDDEDLHLDELAHSFDTEGSDLSRVEIGIDFNFFVRCFDH